jgi:Ca2+-binding EF-hand superfamily protein
MIGAISSKKKIKKEEWEDFIEKFDENKDKQIDYGEFKKMMMSFHDHFAENDQEEEANKK